MAWSRKAVSIPLALFMLLVLYFLATVTVWQVHQNAHFTRLSAETTRRHYMARSIANEALIQLLAPGAELPATGALLQRQVEGVELTARVEAEGDSDSLIRVEGLASGPGAAPVTYTRVLQRVPEGKAALYILSAPSSLAVYRDGEGWMDLTLPRNLYWEERLNQWGSVELARVESSEPVTGLVRGHLAADQNGTLFFLNIPPGVTPDGMGPLPRPLPSILAYDAATGWHLRDFDDTVPRIKPNQKIAVDSAGKIKAGKGKDFAASIPLAEDAEGQSGDDVYQLLAGGRIVHQDGVTIHELAPPPDSPQIKELAAATDGQAYGVGVKDGVSGLYDFHQMKQDHTVWGIGSPLDTGSSTEPLQNLFFNSYGKPVYNKGDRVFMGGKELKGRTGAVVAAGGYKTGRFTFNLQAEY